MPRGDRTGPAGFGSRTGRGLGYCAGYSTPGYTKGWPGRGMGMRWGRGGGGGWGWRWRSYAPAPYPWPETPFPPLTTPWTTPAPAASPEDEKKYLQTVLQSLDKEIEVIKNRIAELEE
ncbi:MAG: DUF5320 domain-containing protein [Candidatus Odinarchaeota archaeon]